MTITTSFEDQQQQRQSLAIGVDVGGTHILAVLANTEGQVQPRHRAHRRLEAAQRSDTEGIITTIAECIVELIISIDKCQYDENNDMNIVGLGLAIPGNVDPHKGTTRYLPNFGWTEEVPLADKLLNILRQKLSKSSSVMGTNFLQALEKNGRGMIQMRNDGRCAALAERHYGIGKQLDSKVFCMLTLGTGIGGAVCIGKDGVLLDGCSFDAGDFGHHVICSGDEAFDCACGKRGCFETHASSAGLGRHYRRQLAIYGKTDEAKNVSLDDAKRIVDLMRAGDEVAIRAWNAFQADLISGLANVVTFYNPEVICLGGGIAQAKELFQVGDLSISEAVDAKTLPATRGKCKVVPGTLGSDLVALGATRLVFWSAKG